jgi:hypothetical protein
MARTVISTCRICHKKIKITKHQERVCSDEECIAKWKLEKKKIKQWIKETTPLPQDGMLL